jgi:hypothetical protein
MSEERNAIPLIITGICSILGTVGALWWYGYLHFAKPEDALLLSDFTLLKTVPGEDYRVSLEPAAQVAQCIDGVLVMFDTEQEKSRALHRAGDAAEAGTLAPAKRSRSFDLKNKSPA